MKQEKGPIVNNEGRTAHKQMQIVPVKLFRKVNTEGPKAGDYGEGGQAPRVRQDTANEIKNAGWRTAVSRVEYEQRYIGVYEENRFGNM